MLPEKLSKLKKNISHPIIIQLICILSIFLFLWILQPILWPGGFGIEKSKSISTAIIEKNAQGKVVKTIETIKYDDGKTLWDWGGLLGVPFSLAILGYVLQQQQQKRAEKLSEEQRNIADNETKEEVLQTYFDRLSVLLIDKNLIALSNKLNLGEISPEEKDLLGSSRNVIRARTLSILRRFEKDVERKTSVMRFLVGADIVGKLELGLSGADLSGAKLIGANLIGANLIGANLIEADLFYANLTEANLLNADLSGANLSMATLTGAKLTGTKLIKADLSAADLSEASLLETDLRDIKWNSNTKWPEKSNFIDVKNIPEQLRKELGITP